MEARDLAKLLAAKESPVYETEYFNRCDAEYLCSVENVLITQNKSFENRFVFEFEVLSNGDSASANRVGSNTKVIYSLQPWDLDKIKKHLQGMLGVSFSTMSTEEQEQLIFEAIEPRQEKDGKSVLSGLHVRVTTTMTQSAKRAQEGKDPFVKVTIQRAS